MMREAGLQAGAQEKGHTLAAFDDFDRAVRADLLVTATAITMDRHAAADAVQDALIAAYRSWDEVGRLERPDLWVRRVMINRAIDDRRRAKRWRGVVGRLGRSTSFERQLGDTAAFWHAVSQLAPAQRKTIVLRAVDELSVKEIAEVMEVAEGTVKATLHQARARLRQLLEIDEPTSNEGSN